MEAARMLFFLCSFHMLLSTFWPIVTISRKNKTPLDFRGVLC